MTRLFRRNKTKQIVCIVLTVLLLVGLVIGLYSLISDKTTKEVHPLFSIGALDNNGKYKESKESIYTKKAFECDGLKVVPNFECTVSYEVFFYDKDGVYINRSGVQTGVYESEPTLFASYARIVITPIEDDSINIFEVVKYANQIKIEVDKKQSIEVDFGEDIAVVLGAGNFDVDSKIFTASNSAETYYTDIIDVSTMDSIIIKIKTSTLTNTVSVGSFEFDALLIYDCTPVRATVDDESNNSPVIYVDGNYSYIEYDVSSINSLRICVDADSSSSLEVYEGQ